MNVKRNVNQIILGVIILMCGVIFLGNTLNIWHVDIFFEGWWTLFIIIPAFIELVSNKETFWSSLTGVIIGVLLLITCQDIISWNKMFEIFLPIVIIILGLSLIFHPTFKRIHKKDGKDDTFVGVFSGIEQKITELDNDIKVVTVFGGVELDLTELKITKDFDIDCTCVFGGVDIFLPDNVQVRLNGLPLFGGIDNKYKMKDKAKYTINLNYLVAFGEIDIK